ncbi:hypothetical protein ACW73L_07320 [Methylolobus aquaticus]
MSSRNNTQQIPAMQVSPEVIAKFIENQGRELDLKARELQLQEQQDKHSFEYSKQALAAKADDLERQRAHEHKAHTSWLIFLGALALLITSIVLVALFLNQSAIATEIIKAIVLVAGGGFGGYGLGRRAKAKQSGTDDE